MQIAEQANLSYLESKEYTLDVKLVTTICDL